MTKTSMTERKALLNRYNCESAKEYNEKIDKGEILAYIHANVAEKIEEAKEKIQEAYKISKQKPTEYKHILNII